jgi:hypothetical protein
MAANVRFTHESGHFFEAQSECPLSANSGIPQLFDHPLGVR